ncbi:hypothetical protein INT47_003638 [Mucor saturninus]|uniref:UBX domain-containing protein 2 n=1 Tax=Mucor saturninus TaxID=64648 RepID=A0A8H7R8U5_9FUNG|nr:hypothetical protein INT47_003638 [Mucor saturninus]
MSSVWFDGPVQDAISLVAQRNCVFLVYIHDDSEKTSTLNATLSEPHVIQTIQEHAIALSFEKSSENATLFGQFYPIQTVPILYFIKQGTIKDFGIDTITSDEIVEKIIQVSEMGQPPIVAAVPDQLDTPSPATSRTPILPANEPVASAPASVASSSAEITSTPAPVTAALTTETDEIKAKKAELQKQLEYVRKERAEREKNEAKAREIKRREEAKLMQEARQSRVDQENKIYFEKIKKEKLQDEAHRKKVREQIATDRAEKMASQRRERERSSLPHLQQQEVHSNSGNSSNSEFSNLNIRQLNGTNLRNKFEATTTLSHVKDWISQNRTDDRKPFKLSSQFPTRAFTDEDNDTTLRDLDLCPSATIIMKPLKKSSSLALHNRVGIMKHAVNAFDIVYGFLIALINMLTGIFTSLFTNTPRVAQQQQNQQQQPFVRSLRGGQRLGGEPVTDKGESSSTDPTVKKRNPYATRVNTLHEDDDDEDKRSTYNGNSVNHE